MGLGGAASAAGTERFRQRFPALDPSHFRRLQDLWVTSVGLGTYLGDADDDTDARYGLAIREALAHSCNLLDTAINYRGQRSERVIGRTLGALVAGRAIARDEVIVCTKGGYLPFDAEGLRDPARFVVDTVINRGLAGVDEIVGGCHCLAPAYLEESLRTSLANLQVATIDAYYLHNPEEQLRSVTRETLLQRVEAAYELLEQRVCDGMIGCYGVATWDGLRIGPTAHGSLSLEELVRVAVRVGGTGHHFRVIQLPYNLAMPEAFSFKNQRVEGEPMTVLAAAARLGLSVVISASLLQSRLATLPGTLADRIPGVSTSAQRALQFVRSTPGVVAALVGMQTPAHVGENLALAHQPLLDEAVVRRLFDRTGR